MSASGNNSPNPAGWNREQLLALLDQVIADSREVLAAAERSFARQAAYTEKLILLDGGTLTLTFTALADVGSRISAGHYMSDSRELFWAWSLLIGAIVSCIFAQKLALTSASNWMVAQHSKVAMMRQKEIPKMLQLLEPGLLTTQKADEVLAGLDQHAKEASPQLRMAVILAFSAEAFTVSAFVLLLAFMKANMSVFFGG
jgi:hypothetical protein